MTLFFGFQSGDLMDFGLTAAGPQAQIMGSGLALLDPTLVAWELANRCGDYLLASLSCLLQVARQGDPNFSRLLLQESTAPPLETLA